MNKPKVSFVSLDVEELEAAAKSACEVALGRTLAPVDPVYLLVKSLLAVIVNQYSLLEFCAKQNLLAFATGSYLDCLGQLVGVTRLPASYASTTLELRLSAPRLTTTIIRKGTRVTADNQTFFSLDSDCVFLPGVTALNATATCQSVGSIGNGFAPGELSRIVDPQPFLSSIVNVTTSDGGADIEDDESLRERIHLAPESFSCASSEGSYIARTKEASALIADVAVTSPSPGRVDVYILMQDGQLPSDQMLQLVAAHLNAKTVRPLTDLVAVKAPAQVDYQLDVSCYISNDDRANAAQITQDVQSKIDAFVAWQAARLGRDLNPSRLSSLLMSAGLKRVHVNQPAFQTLDPFSVARCSSEPTLHIIYEDD